MRRSTTLLAVVALAASVLVGGLAAGPAQAVPVATDAVTYEAFGRVFPDPHGCLDGAPTTSPWAKGNACAVQFLQWDQVLAGIGFLEEQFPDHVQLLNLHDQFGDLPELAQEELQSAGLPRPDLSRDRRDLYVVKVTNRKSPVPEADRRHFAYALSIHGIERAGIEGGIRAIEDLVSWAGCEHDADNDSPVCANEGPFPKQILEPFDQDPGVIEEAAGPTAGQVADHGVTYFVLANPDGWHRGELTRGGAFFQRYNGNGMDLNRDWPTVGFTDAKYTPFSEPETRGYGRFLEVIRDQTSEGRFAGAIDLHGMVTAPSFSFTLLGAGQRDYRKNAVTVDTSIRTFRDAERRLTWSPLILPADECPGDLQEPVYEGTVPMCSDQWGTVWDTINYQVTGSFGDWMDSDIGLDGVGIDNEMALSHLAPNTVFEPGLEQLHIDGNKGLIYSQIASLLFEPDTVYAPDGRIAYVLDDDRIVEEGGEQVDDPHARYPTQRSIEGLEVAGEGFEFAVEGPADGVSSDGVTVEATFTNVGGVSAHSAGTLVLERRGGTGHVGDDPDEWEEVARYFNQSPLYLQAGARIDLNDPLPGEYRIAPNAARVGPTEYVISFSRDRAFPQPEQAPYDVSRMDFFDDLNDYVADEADAVQPLRPEDVLADPSVLQHYDTVVLANAFLPGTDPTPEERAAYASALQTWVEGGGNLVLTDSAVQGLEDLGIAEADAVTPGFFYAGWMDFNDGTAPTYPSDPDASDGTGHPLAWDVDKEGTAEGNATVDGTTFANRHQTYEPTPLGFFVSSTGASNASCTADRCDAPNWIVDQDAWESAGGTTAARTLVRATPEPNSGSTTGVSLGELALGDGVVRIAGALLPDPSQENFHPYGLRSYALTYTGYQLFENLTRWDNPGRVDDGRDEGPGGTPPDDRTDRGRGPADRPAPGQGRGSGDGAHGVGAAAGSATTDPADGVAAAAPGAVGRLPVPVAGLVLAMTLALAGRALVRRRVPARDPDDTGSSGAGGA